MALPSDYSNGKYLKKFTDLGPYLRSLQCQKGFYFFDSLVVCLDTKEEPEEREFFGWWLELQQTENEFIYHYQLGIFDKQANWQSQSLKDKADLDTIELNLQKFHQRLSDLLGTLEIKLTPSPEMAEFKLKLSA